MGKARIIRLSVLRSLQDALNLFSSAHDQSGSLFQRRIPGVQPFPQAAARWCRTQIHRKRVAASRRNMITPDNKANTAAMERR
jgi:hypothetical protein